jgi:hypothetical protein
MWELEHRLRTLVSDLLSQRPARRVSPSGNADWLPPVLGPGDWSIGMLADRSASWYFDRDRA